MMDGNVIAIYEQQNATFMSKIIVSITRSEMQRSYNLSALSI